MVGVTPASKSGVFLGVVAVASASAFLLVSVFDSALYHVLPVNTYLIVHTLLEFLSIIVSFSLFLVNWEVREQERNTRTVFIACGFLAVALIDTMHTLSYNGMPDFGGPNSVSKAAQYWIIARLWAAFILLISAFLPQKSASSSFTARAFLLLNIFVAGLSFVWINFFPQTVPVMFDPASGLTPLKIVLEYVVICMSLIGIAAYWRLYNGNLDSAAMLLVSALMVSVFSELAFTLYASAYDTYNLLGHIYKVIAYFLLFRSLFATSVKRPYAELTGAYAELETTFHELDRRNEELAALNALSDTTSHTLSVGKILNDSLDKLLELFGLDGGAVFLANDVEDTLLLSISRGMPSFYVEDCQLHPYKVGEGIVGEVAQTGKPVLAEDFINDPRVQRESARDAKFTTFIGIPIAARGKVLGTLVLASSKPRRFPLRNIDLLLAAGNQLALAVENARLYQETDKELKRRVKELEIAEKHAKFLAEASTLFNSSLQIQEILQMVTEKAIEVFGDVSAVYFLDQVTGKLEVKSLSTRDPRKTETIMKLFAEVPPELGVGVIGKAAETGKSCLVTEKEIAELSPKQRVYIDQLLLRSTLAVPLKIQDLVVGVLSSASFSEERLLKQEHLVLAEDLAARASAAIANARLYEQAVEERKRSAAITEVSADGIMVVDSNHRIVSVNPALEQMTGYTAGELIGSRCQYLLGARMNDGSSICDVACPLLSGQKIPHRVVESTIFTRDGREAWVGITYGVMTDEEGNTTGVVHTIRDISARKEAERLKDEFTAAISHELRTPLTAILGYSDLLIKGIPDKLTPSQVRHQHAIRKSAIRLLALINDILDVSKLESGMVQLNLAPTSIEAAIENAVGGVATMASSKGVALMKEMVPGLPQAMADQEKLGQILSNLLSNAVKFTPTGGTVTVSCGVETSGEAISFVSEAGKPACVSKPMILIEVCDTGIGISPEKLSRVWDRFYQVESSASRQFGGTGLGLAIVKSLVELHGGTVRVESDGPNKGSTFAFTLPAA